MVPAPDRSGALGTFGFLSAVVAPRDLRAQYLYGGIDEKRETKGRRVEADDERRRSLLLAVLVVRAADGERVVLSGINRSVGVVLRCACWSETTTR